MTFNKLQLCDFSLSLIDIISEVTGWEFDRCHGNVRMLQGGHSAGKPGKVREFQSGQGKVRETEICFSVQLTYCTS